MYILGLFAIIVIFFYIRSILMSIGDFNITWEWDEDDRDIL